jgi:hypothetical protein
MVSAGERCDVAAAAQTKNDQQKQQGRFFMFVFP